MQNIVSFRALSVDQGGVAEPKETWLRTYYFLRAGFTASWIGLSLSIGDMSLLATAALLVIYPAWDALANFLDAERSGGLAKNFSQSLNLAASSITAAAVLLTVHQGMKPVLFIFGAWAILAGVFQLVTGVRRWKSAGAQWAMVLSGAQSALAGTHFFAKANAVSPPGVATIVPYAAFGAVYFLVSALLLIRKTSSKRTAPVAA